MSEAVADVPSEPLAWLSRSTIRIRSPGCWVGGIGIAPSEVTARVAGHRPRCADRCASLPSAPATRVARPFPRGARWRAASRPLGSVEPGRLHLVDDLIIFPRAL